MNKTYDLHVKAFEPLISPNALKQELPISNKASETVISARNTIQRIIKKEDPRLLVVMGPSSIHDEASAREYAERLSKLMPQVSETLFPKTIKKAGGLCCLRLLLFLFFYFISTPQADGSGLAIIKPKNAIKPAEVVIKLTATTNILATEIEIPASAASPTLPLARVISRPAINGSNTEETSIKIMLSVVTSSDPNA